MKIIITSAIIPEFYEQRKIEYLDSLNIISRQVEKNNIIILETVLSGGSFFEEIGFDVFYSQTHNNSLKNKGVKEANAIINFFEKRKIDDDELVVKLTGRYKLLSNYFFDIVNHNNYDCYYLPHENQVFFGCFAIRKKFFSHFLKNLDINYMENRMINIELMFSEFLGNFNIKSYRLDKLELYSNINNNHKVIW
jgi:hypothetical protein